jgi:hypothetical protein
MARKEEEKNSVRNGSASLTPCVRPALIIADREAATCLMTHSTCEALSLGKGNGLSRLSVFDEFQGPNKSTDLTEKLRT